MRALSGTLRRQNRGESGGRPPLGAFASDLDRTLLAPGRGLPRSAYEALEAAKRLGLYVVVVSGREHSVLRKLVAELPAIDALVGENGAVVESPRGSVPVPFGRTAAARARRRLVGADVDGIETGEVVISAGIERRRELEKALRGVRVDLVENVNRVMVLPRGISKRSGLEQALRRLGAAHVPFAAVGDASNDLPLLRAARLSAAVANAEPMVRSSVHYVCRRRYSEGVREFVAGPVRDLLLGRAKPASAPTRSRR